MGGAAAAAVGYTSRAPSSLHEVYLRHHQQPLRADSSAVVVYLVPGIAQWRRWCCVLDPAPEEREAT